MWLLRSITAVLLICLGGQAQAQGRDRYFVTSDGVRLHYLEAGSPTARTIVFVPGWTMPAWIWVAQIQAFSPRYHVIAFDPRGQGDSAIPPGGYEPVRRGQDINELLQHLGPPPVVVVAWSLGVLDTLAAIHIGGDRMLAGLVLVDNSVGEEPAPVYHPLPRRKGPPPPREVAMRQFVKAMFARPQPEFFLNKLTDTCLRTPEYASKLLLAYPMPRSYWREAVYAARIPLLYMIRPHWIEQGQNLLRNRPNTELDVFSDVGHAIFIDDSSRFDRDLGSFLQRRIWP